MTKPEVGARERLGGSDDRWRHRLWRAADDRWVRAILVHSDLRRRRLYECAGCD